MSVGVRGRSGGGVAVLGGVPAMFEVREESLFEFGGDVAVGLDDAVVQVVAEAAGLGYFGDVVGDEPCLWLWRSPWKVRPGLIG